MTSAMSHAVPNVIHLVISLAPGGLERMVIDLTNKRNQRYPDSTQICCLDETGEWGWQVQGDRVMALKADRSRFPWDRSTVRRLRALFKSLSVAPCALPSAIPPRSSAFSLQPSAFCPPVILHAHNMAAWQYGVLATLGTRVRLVYTQHGANPHLPKCRTLLRSIVFNRFTDQITTVSESTANVMAQRQGMTRSRIAVIPNGVKIRDENGNRELDKTKRKTGIRRQLGISEDAFVVGSVGRFSPEKNYPRLVRAFGAFHSQCPSSLLLLVGDGGERSAIDEAIQRCSLGTSILMPGMQGETRKWFDCMDVFCLVSQVEGMSMSLLEACAAGVPSIVTDVGANALLVENDVTGVVLPRGDEKSIVAALERLYGDRSLCPEMGEKARCRAAERYSLKGSLDAYESLYRV